MPPDVQKQLDALHKENARLNQEIQRLSEHPARWAERARGGTYFKVDRRLAAILPQIEAVFLQDLYNHAGHLKKDEEGYFLCTSSYLEKSFFWSEKQQRDYLSSLKDKGLIKTKRSKGIPARRMVRVESAVVERLLDDYENGIMPGWSTRKPPDPPSSAPQGGTSPSDPEPKHYNTCDGISSSAPQGGTGDAPQGGSNEEQYLRHCSSFGENQTEEKPATAGTPPFPAPQDEDQSPLTGDPPCPATPSPPQRSVKGMMTPIKDRPISQANARLMAALVGVVMPPDDCGLGESGPEYQTEDTGAAPPKPDTNGSHRPGGQTEKRSAAALERLKEYNKKSTQQTDTSPEDPEPEQEDKWCTETDNNGTRPRPRPEYDTRCYEWGNRCLEILQTQRPRVCVDNGTLHSRAGHFHTLCKNLGGIEVAAPRINLFLTDLGKFIGELPERLSLGSVAAVCRMELFNWVSTELEKMARPKPKKRLRKNNMLDPDEIGC
jgi:hypothetical protein